MELADVKDSNQFKNKIASFIDYYIFQYGEEYRDLITERFNNIIFCIYKRPDYSSYLEIKYTKLISLYAIAFLKELNFDNYKYDGYSVVPNDGNIHKLLDITFAKSNKYSIYYSPFTKFKEKNVDDILLEDRLFVEQVTGKNIIEVLSIANKYIKKLMNMKIIDIVDNAFQEAANYRKNFNNEFNNYLLNDFDINQFKYKERIMEELKNASNLGASYLELRKDGKYVPVVYISPFGLLYRDYDLILDHEIRHAIEMSLDANKKLKTGLSVSEGIINETNQLNFKYRLINEVMTQKMSIESTIKRQNDDIMIFSDRKLDPNNHLTGYDAYISLFDELVDESLYKDLVEARIGLSYSKTLEKRICGIEEILIHNKYKKALN